MKILFHYIPPYLIPFLFINPNKSKTHHDKTSKNLLHKNPLKPP